MPKPQFDKWIIIHENNLRELYNIFCTSLDISFEEYCKCAYESSST